VRGILQDVASAVFSVGVVLALIQYVRDRRTIKAKGTVAERTVESQVDADRLKVYETRLALLNQTHAAERGVLLATIAHKDQEIHERDLEIAQKDARLAELQREIEEMRERLRVMANQVEELLHSRPHEATGNTETIQE
jgi:DNA repair ATPase RecN